MTHRYDPQDRPIYPVGSYWEQIGDSLYDHPESMTFVFVIMVIGVLAVWLLLEWVY